MLKKPKRIFETKLWSEGMVAKYEEHMQLFNEKYRRDGSKRSDGEILLRRAAQQAYAQEDDINRGP
jgi:hypothetical protein